MDFWDRLINMMPFHHCQHFLVHSTDSSPFWGAFWGAFLAFLFGFITYIVTKRRERYVEHKNALVKLERILYSHLDDFEVMESVATDTRRVMGQQHVTSNRLLSLEIPTDIDIELGNMDLINKLFAYRLRIKRLNINVASINHSLTRLEDLSIGGQPVHPTNFAFISGTIQTLIAEFPRVKALTEELLILVKIHNRKLKAKISFIYGVFNTEWEPVITPEEIETERERLDAEIQ
jgi:hypothetical protein